MADQHPVCRPLMQSRACSQLELSAINSRDGVDQIGSRRSRFRGPCERMSGALRAPASLTAVLRIVACKTWRRGGLRFSDSMHITTYSALCIKVSISEMPSTSQDRQAPRRSYGLSGRCALTSCAPFAASSASWYWSSRRRPPGTAKFAGRAHGARSVAFRLPARCLPAALPSSRWRTC